MAGVGDVGSGGRGMDIGKRRFPASEVGRVSRERTVDVKPGTGGTTSFCMLCVFCKPMSMNDTIPSPSRLRRQGILEGD